MDSYQRTKEKAVFWLCAGVATAFFAVVHGLADRITNGAPL